MSTGVIDNIHRPFAKVSPSPSLWGDLFIKPHSNPQVTEKYSKEIEGLKNEVRSMLTTPECKMADTIDLIDKLERLGVSYHFEKEIEEKMKQFFNVIKADHHHYKDEAYDLCTVALHFRLFRQHGYNLSSDVFERWMDGEGKFKENLKNDAKGLLSLYEACCLRTRGETLLDDALVFAGANLKSMVGNLRSPLREQVEHALFQQLHYGVQRIEARHFISIYENVLNRNETLHRFAKVDFNAVQILHKNELSKVSRWWKELNLISKLPYARDRVVECFLWAVAVYYEPHYSRARIMLTKCIAIVSVLDDTYDTYGTREELDALTEAIERWNIQETDTLPEYIKGFYKTILKLYMEFEEKLAKEGRSYAAYYTIESFKELARSYHVEAKWFTQGYLPPFEEYLDNALITSVVPHLSCSASFLGVESVKSKDFEWLLKKPKLVVASQIYNRFVDDASSHKVETERGQIGNGIDCYMKTYGVTKEEAKNRFYERATDAWKDTTEEWLNWPSSCSKDVYILMLNYNRIVHVAYKNDEDGYTQPEKVLMPHIIALFVHQFDI